jgi:hypothetical protein
VTPAERLEAAGRWLASAGGAATPGEVGTALELNHARQADVLRDLTTRGLIVRSHTRVELTEAGWARFAGAAPDSAGEVLDRALAGWPQTHRALVELMAAAVIARHHLGAARPEGHLGFMAIGPTGTGKSAAGRLVCHLFGWPLDEHLVHVPAETVGSLLGRRERVDDGDGWRFVPAPTTALPFLVLDEWDKADREVQRHGWRYFDGKLRVRAETGWQEMRPTPLLTANGDPAQVTRPEYRRRSAVLSTAAMAGRGREIGRLLRRLSPTDRLDLGRLVPPARLDEAALAVLEVAEEFLTEAGREEFDLPGLELAALGRCALLGAGADHELAALGTVVAYLQVTESRPGQVRPGWTLDAAAVRQQHGAGAGVEALLAAVDRGRRAVDQARQAVHEGRQRHARAELAVLEAGEALADRCRKLRDKLDGRRLAELPEQRRNDAAGLRRILALLAARAAQVSTEASLRDVRAQAADPLARGAALVAEAAAARQQRVDDAAEARRQVQDDRQAAKKVQAWERSREAAARRQRAEQLAAVVAAAKPLEALYARKTTKPTEDPLATLLGLRVPGYDQPLLVYVSPPPAPPAKGWRRLLTTQPSGHWQVTGSGVRFAGTRSSCPALAAWGPGTRAVLAPVLAALHAQEDRLRTGRRQGRPRVDPAVDAAAAVPPLRALPGPSGTGRDPSTAVAR